MSKRVTVIVEGREYVVEVGDLSDRPIKATVNQRTYQVETPGSGESAEAPAGDRDTAQATPASPAATGVSRPAAPANKTISAPMPGNIIEVKVKAGDSVQSGDVICVLEAMKMNNMIYADQAGIIASVEVVAGQAVDYGAALATFQ